MSGHHGDETFERWFREYHTRLLAQCRRIVGDAATAEDIAQETLLRAWLGRDRMREEDLGAWLSVVARNLCISHLRRQKKQIPTEVLPETPDEAADPSRIVERLESRRAVRRAMRQVGGRHGRVLQLRDIEGVEYEKLRTELGLSEAGARTVLFRARRMLRDRLVAIGEGIAVVYGAVKLRVKSLDHRARMIVNDAAAASFVQAGAVVFVAATVAFSSWTAPGAASLAGLGRARSTPARVLAAFERQDAPASAAKSESVIAAPAFPKAPRGPRPPIKTVVNPPACGERPSVIEETQTGLPYELRYTLYFNGEGPTGPYTDAVFATVDQHTTFPNECGSPGGST